mgnify:CR=1 FL=1
MILKMMTNYAGDYGKNLRQRRWAFLAILAIGLVGLGCYVWLVPDSGLGDYAQGFYLGGACGITGAGLGLLMRNEWMLRHPEKWKRARIQETDERSQRIVAQAAQLAGVGVFFLQALAAFVLVAVDRRLVTVLLCSMSVYVLLFLALGAVLHVASLGISMLLRLPLLSSVNTLGGALLGLLEGMMVVWLLIWLLPHFGIELPTEETYLLRFFTAVGPLGLLASL